MKKKKYRWKVIVIVVLLAISIGIFYLLFMRGNVMDEIYKAARRSDFEAFNKVKELEGARYVSQAELETFSALRISYKKEYLKKNMGASLPFPVMGDIIEVSGYITIADSTKLFFDMSYDSNHKTMTYESIHVSATQIGDEFATHYYDAKNVKEYLDKYNITKEDVTQYQKYILYDVVIKTWVEANGGNFETARKKMEKCKLINHTFTFPEKDEIPEWGFKEPSESE